MGAADHEAHAPARAEVRIGVVTVSDTRTAETDEGGRLVRRMLGEAGFSVASHTIVKDEPADVRALVAGWAKDGAHDAILLTGGTGVGGRDSTADAVATLLDKTLDGYGEIFRLLSFAEIGPAAMLSRAVGGAVGRCAVFVMPGSPAGVRLALDRLIIPELAHVVGELRRHADHGHRHAG